MGTVAAHIVPFFCDHVGFICREYADFRVSSDGEVQGVGLLIAQEPSSGRLVVLAPIRGGPADKAGVLPGDEASKFTSRMYICTTITKRFNLHLQCNCRLSALMDRLQSAGMGTRPHSFCGAALVAVSLSSWLVAQRQSLAYPHAPTLPCPN